MKHGFMTLDALDISITSSKFKALKLNNYGVMYIDSTKKINRFLIQSSEFLDI